MGGDQRRGCRPRQRRPLIGRHRVRRQRRERVGDRLGIAGGSEDAEHPRGRDAREEVLEIEPHDHVPADVRGGVAARGPAAREAVCGLVRGDPVEQLVQQAPLDRLQSRLGPLDRARRTAVAGQPGVAVVAQPLVGDPALEPAGVGEPGELAVPDLEEARQGVHRMQLGHRPAAPPHRELGQEPAANAGRLDGIGRSHLLQLQREEGGQLARSVRRGAVVGGQHRAHEPPDPRRPRLEHGGTASKKTGLLPRSGQAGVRQAVRQAPARRAVVHRAPA